MVTVEERYEHLEKTIRGYNISADFAQIRAAYEYANAHHGAQLRRDGTPYITHPINVAQIVAEMRLDSESIIAALLHDCIEDTDTTYEDVAKIFGVTVADIVDGVGDKGGAVPAHLLAVVLPRVFIGGGKEIGRASCRERV